jgi:hypothetical protein
MTIAAALVVAVLLAPMPGAHAADPTLADVAGCNEEASARTTGSALPRPDRPDARAGAPIVEGERSLPPQGRGEKSDPTGSIVTDSADPLVRGMDAQRAGDPAYRAAYRECMQHRGVPSR